VNIGFRDVVSTKRTLAKKKKTNRKQSQDGQGESREWGGKTKVIIGGKDEKRNVFGRGV